MDKLNNQSKINKDYITYDNGTIIKAIRILCKPNQKISELAKDMKSSCSYLSEIENNKKSPSKEFLNKLDNVYGFRKDFIYDIIQKKLGRNGTYINLIMFICNEIMLNQI